MRATEKTYLRAWKGEIVAGVIAGKLTQVSGKADLKIVAAALEEQEDATK